MLTNTEHYKNIFINSIQLSLKGRWIVSEEEIVAINEAALFYPSDLVNTKTTPQGQLRVSVYIHCSSPTLRGIVVLVFTTKSDGYKKAGLINK